ncbi:MAG: SLOG family protein [Actinomycetota bacterium]|nr:SLOG family protein [Actinomycetota bacterium]
MIVAITGHRPNKLGGFDPDNPTRLKVRRWLHRQFEEFKPTKVISGMAMGVDQWAVEEALTMGIPVLAAVPSLGQANLWPQDERKYWRLLLESVHEVEIVCKGTRYHPSMMQIRNAWMVDRCDLLLAVWDGSPGGTANCVKYAELRDKRIVRVTPLDFAAEP